MQTFLLQVYTCVNGFLKMCSVPVVEATAIAVDDFFSGSDAAAKARAKGPGGTIKGTACSSADTADSSSGGGAGSRNRRWPASLRAGIQIAHSLHQI